MKKILAALAILVISILAIKKGLAAEIKVEDEQRKISIPRTYEIQDNLILVGNEVEFSGKVLGDLIVLSGKFNFKGEVLGNVYAVSGETKIDGKISGDVFLASASSDLGQNTVISRNLYLYTSNLTRSPKSQIVGKDVVKKIQNEKKEPRKIIISWLISVLGLLLVGIILWKIFPQDAQKTFEIIKQKPFKTLLWGILTSILAPILAVIFFLTLVGIPLSVIILGFYFFAIYISSLIVALYLSIVLLPKRENPLPGAALFLIILTLLYKIPFLGGLFLLITIWLGMGTLVQIKK